MQLGVIGAGFAGLATAVAMRQMGHEVTVYERADSLPSEGGGGIALSANGLACLDALGVRDRIHTADWSARPATIRDRRGRVLMRRTLGEFAGGPEFAVVPRAELIRTMADQLPAECVRYSVPVTRVSIDGYAEIEGTARRFDLLAAADGAYSGVRASIWADARPMRVTGITAWTWIVDLPVTDYGVIWGRTAEFGILPLHDGRTYVYGATCVGHTDLTCYRDWPDPLPDLIAAVDTDSLTSVQLVDSKPPRRVTRGKVVLLGDSAHAMHPTIGQGAALAMEDALTLARVGTRELERRRRRIRALSWGSRLASAVALPRSAAAEQFRNVTFRALPGPLLGAVMNRANRWQVPAR